MTVNSDQIVTTLTCALAQMKERDWTPNGPLDQASKRTRCPRQSCQNEPNAMNTENRMNESMMKFETREEKLGEVVSKWFCFEVKHLY